MSIDHPPKRRPFQFSNRPIVLASLAVLCGIATVGASWIWMTGYSFRRPVVGRYISGPIAIGNITDLSADATTILRTLPNVASVTRHGSDKPTHRIIHILDWHLVDRPAFYVDMIDVTEGEPPTDQELAKWYDEHLAEVEAVQQQQHAALLHLAKHHGLTHVHLEGLTDADKVVLDASVSAIKATSKDLAQLQRERAELVALVDPDELTQAAIDAIDTLIHGDRIDRLRIGAVTQLLIDGTAPHRLCRVRLQCRSRVRWCCC